MPRWLGIGEDTNERLLSVKKRREGDEDGLDELCKARILSELFDNGIEGSGWWNVVEYRSFWLGKLINVSFKEWTSGICHI